MVTDRILSDSILILSRSHACSRPAVPVRRRACRRGARIRLRETRSRRKRLRRAGDIAVSLLFDMPRPDMAAEVADLLMRMENVAWVVCLGIYEDQGVMSVRAADSNAKAGRLVRIIAGRNGSAGGHNTMAGGRIHLPNKTPAERIAELHALVPRFLKELGAGDDMGVALLEAE